MEPKINAAVAVPPAACRPPASSAHSSAAALYDAPHASSGHHRLHRPKLWETRGPPDSAGHQGRAWAGRWRQLRPCRTQQRAAARVGVKCGLLRGFWPCWQQPRCVQVGFLPTRRHPPTHRCCQLPPEQVVTQ